MERKEGGRKRRKRNLSHEEGEEREGERMRKRKNKR